MMITKRESENKIMAMLSIKHGDSFLGVIARDIINCNDETKLPGLRDKLQTELSRFIDSECK